MKETKGRRRRRIFAGMTLADLRLLKRSYQLGTGGKIVRGIKVEELTAEIERREKIAAGMVNQPRAGGRFARVPKEELTLTAAINKGRFLAAAKERAKRPASEGPTKKATTQVIVIDWAEVEVSLRRIIREELTSFFSPEEPERPSLLRRLKRWLL